MKVLRLFSLFDSKIVKLMKIRTVHKLLFEKKFRFGIFSELR